MASVLQSGSYETHVEQLQNSYRLKRDALLAAADDFFGDMPGVSWHRPSGGLYVWMTLPESVATGFDGRLFERATKTDKVMYVPGELCYPSNWTERPRNQMRLSFGVLSPELIREGMKRLASAVRFVLNN